MWYSTLPGKSRMDGLTDFDGPLTASWAPAPAASAAAMMSAERSLLHGDNALWFRFMRTV
jgi:hypothetical protein